MKTIKMFLACFLLIAVFGFIGCENSDSSPPKGDITKSSTIKFINNQRTQLELVDGWTLNLIGTVVSIQRPSCSGFDPDSVYQLEIGERVEYSYINNDEVDYAHKTVIPTEVKQFSTSCDPQADGPQYILDTDKDGYTDNIDAFPTDPTQH